jgi:predicted CxxxxCH...CXXCH cytochrome family protein
MATAYTCSRCSGKGRLPQHSTCLGGVCFKCHGSGKQSSKPQAPTPKWAVFGQERATGEWARLYNVRAKTAENAISRARTMMTAGSADWIATYTLTDARALKVADMANPSAITWAEATTTTEQAA